MSDENPQTSPSDANDGTPRVPAPDEAANHQEAPSGAYDYNPPTDGIPAYEPAPAASYPSQPQWSAAPSAPPVVRLRVRDHVMVALSMVLALVLVSGIGYMWFGDSVFAVQQVSSDAPSNRDGASAQDGQTEQAPAGVDLRQGAVFMASNDARGNEVAAFVRNEDGTLREIGRYPTGGKGSGTLEDVSGALILGSWEGESSPTQTVEKAELLFVPDSGSNTITVFRVKADGLEKASQVPSGGEKPISLSVRNGLLYVLNSGEFDDRFILGPDTPPLENCTTGQLPSVTGFRVAPDGVLTPIEGSTRTLTEERDSGCASIAFSPDGKTLIATERRAGKTDAATGLPKGAILTYAVKENGTLGPPMVNEPAGNGPYGITFTKDGTMLIAEQNGADRVPEGGQVSSYTLNGDGTLTTVSGPVITGGTDTCWIVVHDNQKVAFASAPLIGGSVSSMAIGKGGTVSLLHPVASADNGTDVKNDNISDGVLDIALSRDSRYLYALDGFAAGIYGFRVNDNGTLSFIERKQVFNILPLPEGGSGGPNGLSAF
jgi:6-phosphogluconolactonase